jgi:hypothetical protein
MRRFDAPAALIVATFAALPGCAGSQSPSAGMTTLAQTQRDSGTSSWMTPRASKGALLYVSFGCGGTCVLSYPKGELVGSLDVGTGGLCSDAAGDVFITNEASVVEYAHGGTVPIQTLNLSGGASGCGVDPATGNLAVTLASSSGNVAVFQNAQGTPTLYQTDLDTQFCGYDNEGNLFVDGFVSHGQFGFSELAKGSSSFTNITISPSPAAVPYQVQWDGKYISVEGIPQTRGVDVYRLQISGSTAKIVGTTRFRGVTRYASQSWIQGSKIFIPDGVRGNGAKKTKVGVWGYPAGEKSVKVFQHFATYPDFQGVTFSAARR